VAIERAGDSSVTVRWSDGVETVWTARELRAACPCATCRGGHQDAQQSSTSSNALPVLSAAEARPLRVEAMRPVGTYAYAIAFSDGHSSGIFTFPLLRRGPLPSADWGQGSGRAVQDASVKTARKNPGVHREGTFMSLVERIRQLFAALFEPKRSMSAAGRKKAKALERTLEKNSRVGRK